MRLEGGAGDIPPYEIGRRGWGIPGYDIGGRGWEIPGYDIGGRGWGYLDMRLEGGANK